jgi:hypothetical protein
MGDWNGTVPTVLAGYVPTGDDWGNFTGELSALNGAWTSYTPTLTGITIGNGTVTTLYRRIGKTVDYRGNITWGSTTSSGGNWNLSLPVTPFVVPGGIGAAYLSRNSPATVQVGAAALFGSILFFISGTANVASAAPWTWATSDQLLWSITYEVS